MGGVGDGLPIERGRPGTLGQVGGLMPVIDGLVEQHLGPGARRVNEHAARIVEHRHPGLELWVDLERVVLVIQKLHQRGTRHDHEGIEAGARQCMVGAAHERLHVLRVESVQTVLGHLMPPP